MNELQRYNYILQKLSDSAGEKADQLEIEKLAKQWSRLSSRHHYLPQYFIKGFCGQDEKMTVYDKKGDYFHPSRKPTKSMFFEFDRHSIELNGVKLSMLEDEMFSDTDRKLAPYLVRIREQVNDHTLLTTDLQNHMVIFILDLFWRNPSADFAAMDLFQRSKITWLDEKSGKSFQDVERERQFKNDPINQKMERYRVHVESMLQIAATGSNRDTFSKLWEFKNGPFILGDFPIVFCKTPITHNDLVDLDSFLPISSSRIYGNNNSSGLNFDIQDALIANALQIDQAKSYIVAAEKSALEESLRFYKAAKRDGSLSIYKKKLFDKI